MAMSQQEVIKKFMASLDKTNLSGTEAVDEAVNYATNGKFKTAQEVINKMLADRAKATIGDDFLKIYCGINLDNEDTGAITGADAGGSKVKTSTSVVPNGTFDTSFDKTSFTKRGVTFKLCDLTEDGYLYSGSNINNFTSEEKHVWQGLYSFWAEESLKLIEESYNYSFTDSDAKATNIWLYFVDDANAGTAEVRGGILTTFNGKEKYIAMYINMYHFKNIGQNDSDGKHPTWTNYYLDRLIAHELTHAIMAAKVNNFFELPGFIKEGMAELTVGMDDSQYGAINDAVKSKATLAKYLDDKADGLFNEDYVGGYIFLRYLAKQVAGSGLNTINSASNKVISGTAYADNVGNYGNNVKIYADAGADYILNRAASVAIDAGTGNDTVYNGNGASNVSIYGGSGNDSIYNYQGNYARIEGGNDNDHIYNKSWYSTVDAGAGNDTIIDYNPSANSINAGAGNDFVSLYGSYGNITVKGGAGNDTIYGDKTSSYGVLYQYASGDGNDSIIGINAKDTIKITGAEYEKVPNSSSNDVTLKVGNGAILVKDAKNISFTIIGTVKTDNNIVSLSSGNDTYTNSASGKTIYALAGNDKITNSAANVTIDGGAGNDTISNTASSVKIYAGDGNDTIRNANGANYVTIDGGSGKDTINNFESNYAYLIGGQGDDSIYNKSWYSTINGGDGNDIIINYDVGKKTSINGGSGNDIISLSGTNFGGITINGGSGNDKITLTGGNNFIQYASGDGKDVISGFSSTDTLYISSGSVSKVSISGENAILTIGSGSVTLRDVKGKSVKIKNSSGTVTETIFGGDTLPAGISVKSSILTASSSFKGKEIDIADYEGVTKVNASALSSGVSIIGTAAANSIKGGKGADTIFGGAGNDTVSLGGGADIYIYSSGNDLIQDYATVDAIQIDIDEIEIYSMETVSSNVVIKTSEGNLTVKNAKTKKVTLLDADKNEINLESKFPAGWKFDSAKGLLQATISTAENEIDLNEAYGEGVAKVDGSKITSGVYIYGNDLNNSLKGGKGADIIAGGDGNDTVSLGGGADVYIYTGGDDYIQDYATVDAIQFDTINISITNRATVGSNVVFTTDAGTLTVKSAKTKKITLLDSDGEEFTYSKSSKNVAEKIWFLEDDNNFIASDIDSITEEKFTVTEIQSYNNETFTQDENILTFAKEK